MRPSTVAKHKPASTTPNPSPETRGPRARVVSRSLKKADAPPRKTAKPSKSAKKPAPAAKASKPARPVPAAKPAKPAAKPAKPSRAAEADKKSDKKKAPAMPAKAPAKPAPAPAGKKPAAPKPAPKEAAKPDAGKTKPPAKGAAKAAPKSATKAGAKAGAKTPAEPGSNKPRTDVTNRSTSLADARAAASRLAAAAGLKLVKPKPGDDDLFAPAVKPLTKSPLSKKELNHYREILVAKRSQVAGDVNAMESEALTSSGSLSSFPQHLADQGSDEYDQSLSLGLAESQRKLLAEIDAALDRIEKGTYGVCDVLGTPINAERLEATPWSKHSLEGARLLDRRAMFR